MFGSSRRAQEMFRGNLRLRVPPPHSPRTIAFLRIERVMTNNHANSVGKRMKIRVAAAKSGCTQSVNVSNH
jgi:hypothetical protein